MRPALILALAMLPAMASAQTSTPPRSILTPPNPIDRATADSDRRAADARRAAEADRAAASSAARTAPVDTGPVAGSTFTDGTSGFGTRPDTAVPSALPPR
jgi:hypothetical protein